MKRLLIILLVCAVILGTALLLRTAFTPAVLVAQAVTGTAVNAVTGTVEVYAHLDINVKAKHRGQITEMPHPSGTEVAAGDVLAQQESAELDLRIEQIEIRLAAARERDALERRARIDLETLQERRAGTELAVRLGQAPESRLNEVRREERKLEVTIALEEIHDREQLLLLENQLAQLKLQRAEMTTVAPFDGVVAEFRAFPGDLVNGGQNLVRLVSKGRFGMLELTEEDYFGVANGQLVTLRLASFPDRTFTATVTRMEDIANSGSRTRNVIVNIDSPVDLVPGLTGEGLLTKEQRENAVLIPRRALMGNRLYVVEDGRIAIRTVGVGFVGLNQVEITDGLAPGEQVVLEDLNRLSHGMRVRAQSQP